MLDVARRALDAYGGAKRWNEARFVASTVSAHGWALRLKWRPPMERLGARIEIRRPAVRLEMPGRGSFAVLDGFDVRLEDPQGRVLRERSAANRRFPYGRRALWWDDLDFAYFATYALWNYACLPALLLRDDIEWRAVRGQSLQARFPPHLPTHSAVQEFHFDAATGLLRQHDYTAEVFGRWARAANVVEEHSVADVPFTSRRRVTPRRADGSPAPWPLLVGIRFEGFELGS